MHFLDKAVLCDQEDVTGMTDDRQLKGYSVGSLSLFLGETSGCSGDPKELFKHLGAGASC